MNDANRQAGDAEGLGHAYASEQKDEGVDTIGKGQEMQDPKLL